MDLGCFYCSVTGQEPQEVPEQLQTPLLYDRARVLPRAHEGELGQQGILILRQWGFLGARVFVLCTHDTASPRSQAYSPPPSAGPDPMLSPTPRRAGARDALRKSCPEQGRGLPVRARRARGASGACNQTVPHLPWLACGGWSCGPRGSRRCRWFRRRAQGWPRRPTARTHRPEARPAAAPSCGACAPKPRRYPKRSPGPRRRRAGAPAPLARPRRPPPPPRPSCRPPASPRPHKGTARGAAAPALTSHPGRRARAPRRPCRLCRAAPEAAGGAAPRRTGPERAAPPGARGSSLHPRPTRGAPTCSNPAVLARLHRTLSEHRPRKSLPAITNGPRTHSFPTAPQPAHLIHVHSSRTCWRLGAARSPVTVTVLREQMEALETR